LLLQGPKGPFFWRLRKDLEKVGAKVFKINLNGGDFLFYPFGAINFKGKPEEWKDFLKKFLKEKKIDVILMFSDWKFYHRVAVDLAKEFNIEVGVFEEGYIRPYYVTLDRFGVNGNSLLAKLAEKGIGVNDLPDVNYKPPQPKPVGNTFWHEVLWNILYYLGSNIFRPLFPHYRHHISLYFPESIFKLGIPWIKAGIKKYWLWFKEKTIRERLYKELKGKYYLVPLQVHNDSQVVLHSPFKSVEEFIEVVMKSFSTHAPKGTFLVFKHHPRDRAFKDYSKLIKKLKNKLSLEGRVFYIHDGHLPTLIDNSIGVVVINSSVGFQALEHGKPVAVLGKAVYGFRDVVFKDGLDNFWTKSLGFSFRKREFIKLRKLILAYCQLNGSLHKRVFKESNTGLRWENIDIKMCNQLVSQLEELLNVK